MKLEVPPKELVPFGLRALKMIATANGDLSRASSNVLQEAQRILLKTQIDVQQLPPIDPPELSQHLTDPRLRIQFVQAMIMTSMADGPTSPAQMDLIKSFAAALGIDSPELHSVNLLAEKHMLLFKLDYFRHTHIARILVRSFKEDGFVQTVKKVLGMRGLVEDKKVAERYRALAKLPEGTLGKEFANYIQRNKFSFPGEKRGFPEG